MTTLGEVAQIVDCEHKTAPVTPGGGFYAVGTPAMRGNVIAYSEAREIDQETFELWTKRMRPREGDLLFAREAPVGPVVRVPSAENVAPGQRTVLLRVNPLDANPTFISYLLASPFMQAHIATLAAGSTVAHLNVADVRTLELGVLPRLSQQRATAEVLGALDDKIAANRRVAELAVTLCEGLVNEVFSTESVPLGEVAEVIMGSSPKGEYLNEDGDGVTFFQGVRDFGLLSPTRRVFATQPVRMAQAGDVLFAVRAPVGEVNVATEPTCIGRGLAALRAHENPVSFFYTVRGSSHVWNEFQGTGTVFASVNGKEVRHTRLPVIDQDVAPEVEERVSAVHERALSALTESEVLAQTRDELLPLLMSGKITVKDAEKRVEGVV